MQQIFGSVDSDFLPDNYGQDSDVTHPSGEVGSAHFGEDADMSGLPSGEQYDGWLGNKFDTWQKNRETRKAAKAAEGAEDDDTFWDRIGLSKDARQERKAEKAKAAAPPYRFEGAAGYVWDIWPGQKVQFVSGPVTPRFKTFDAGSSTYNQAVKEWEARGRPGIPTGMNPKKAAVIGTNTGALFKEIFPTVLTLFGPKGDVPDFDMGDSYEPPKSEGMSPVAIAGIAILAVGGIVGVAMMVRSKD